VGMLVVLLLPFVGSAVVPIFTRFASNTGCNKIGTRRSPLLGVPCVENLGVMEMEMEMEMEQHPHPKRRIGM
jgi:hypothetical protein